MTPEQMRHLTAELPKSAVDTMDQKGGIPYLQTLYVVNRLNQIFGVGRWCHIVRNHVTRDMEGRGIISHCEVTLNIWTAGNRDALRADIVITDVGVCDASHGNYASNFDMAHKGAISDGIKRCARYLGTQFQAPTEKSEKRKAQRQHPQYWCGPGREAVQARVDRRNGTAILTGKDANKKEEAEETSPAPKPQAPVSIPGPSHGRQPAPMQYSGGFPDGAPPPQGTVEEQRVRLSKLLHVQAADVAKMHGWEIGSTTERIHGLCYQWAGVKRNKDKKGSTWARVPSKTLKAALTLISDLAAAPSSGAALDMLSQHEAGMGSR